MNKKTFLTGLAMGMALTAGAWAIYPRVHSMLPTPVAEKVTAVVNALRGKEAEVSAIDPWQGPAPTGGGATPEPGKPKPAQKPAKLKPGQPKPYHGKLRSLGAINIRDAELDVVMKGLRKPWSMEFIDSHHLLIAEQEGALKRLDLRDRSLVELDGLPEIAAGKGQLGLLDIALHPDFAGNRRIYFSHSVQEPGGDRYATALSTGIIDGDQLIEVRQLLATLPWAKFASNFGGAIAFDDEGFLYFATGDRSARNRAQKPGMLNGKVLRLHDDGSVPADNPFVGRKGFRPELYAQGLRNPQGLVFDSQRGELLATEHGPMGGDEVNVIRAGKNYGWPRITYGMNYAATPIGEGTSAEGLEQPLYYYLPSTAVSPLEIYYGDMFPNWQGHLLVGALKGMHVSKLDYADGRILSEQRILREGKGRVRDIKVAADGSIYVLLQDGGRLLRLHRPLQDAQVAAGEPGKRSGAEIYNTVCVTCHGNQTPGVPQLGDLGTWNALLARGRQTLYANTINGVEAMPARGLCEDCNDEELRKAVDYILSESGQPQPSRP
ncbi:MAG: PQQ-dependent sugar dehydrogenase [Halieaceae bacterium]|nr:PQQ-dependent sugar dehydrogenase [Halieaceae bacterium]